MIKNDNYEVIFEKKVEDIASDAVLLKHKKTGARVFVLLNDDENKTFYIGFRTPPQDSTGVAHIMEHSTLCGSEKFPLKDPFVELAKGSLNTFLNAMTYSDKTVYPVASTNDKDFRNLMDVYMDAVMHPNVYKYPEILKQEGWSYRIESADEPIEYNGVVYNEMKGAFSSPDDLLMRQTMSTLFPDTTYGVESGGDPKFITDLTYEQFIDFHKKYYHPSNSYIYLYGNLDIEEQLSWLDNEYLCHYEKIQPGSEVGIQKPFDGIKEFEASYPITDDESDEKNTYLAYNAVCGSIMDIRMVIAMQMIIYALVDTQGAPVRQRLLDAGIGQDILSSFDDSVLQPYLSIISKNADPWQKDEFVKIIKEEFEKAANEGINKKSLIASLNSIKFKFKEADFGGYPKGLVYGLTALNSWLYDDELPLLHIELGKIFDELEEAINGNYFENLVREIFLENNHASVIVLKPEKGLQAKQEAETAKKLADYKASLSREEIEKLIEETKALAAYQEEPSSKEALESIPLLERADIRREPRIVKNEASVVEGVEFLSHDYNTNGIAYVDIFFDCSDIGKELIPYLSILKSVISFVNTDKHTYSDLNNEINITTGGFGFETGVYTKAEKPQDFSILSDLSMRVLYENIDSAFDLAEEVLFTGRYDDKKRLYEIVAELKSKLQMVLMSAGHIAAASRAASYYSESGFMKEAVNGLEFFKFVEKLEKNFDSEYETFAENIRKVLGIILRKENIFLNCTADEKGIALVRERFAKFVCDNCKNEPGAGAKGDFKDRKYDFAGSGYVIEQKNEAFKTSGSVNYVSRAGRFIDNIDDFSGAAGVFQTIMRYEYLWFNIRVQGGAYGCMCSAKSTGDLLLVTYRDPNIARSNEVFEGIADYLESFDCDEREMTKYVIGTISSIDMPLSPCQKGISDFNIYISGKDDIERRRKIRNQIIDCSSEDIRALAAQIRRALSEGNICCVGNETKIEEDKALFKTVRNIFE